jgi:hypothetical protein
MRRVMLRFGLESDFERYRSHVDGIDSKQRQNYTIGVSASYEDLEKLRKSLNTTVSIVIRNATMSMAHSIVSQRFPTAKHAPSVTRNKWMSFPPHFERKRPR